MAARPKPSRGQGRVTPQRPFTALGWKPSPSSPRSGQARLNAGRRMTTTPTIQSKKDVGQVEPEETLPKAKKKSKANPKAEPKAEATPNIWTCISCSYGHVTNPNAFKCTTCGDKCLASEPPGSSRPASERAPVVPTLNLAAGTLARLGIPANAKATSYTKPAPVPSLSAVEQPAAPALVRRLLHPSGGPGGPPDDDDGDGDDEGEDEEEHHPEDWDGDWEEAGEEECEGGNSEEEDDDPEEDDDDDDKDEEEEEVDDDGYDAYRAENQTSILLRKEMEEMVNIMNMQNNAKRIMEVSTKTKEADSFKAPPHLS